MTQFLVYDVFTDQAYGGNPLAVMPDATGLPETDLQKIAREFNFSESTFVFPPDDPAHDARVRIFTPTRELQFAGHPTIGTALALADLGKAGNQMVLELGVGPIPVAITDGQARFVTRVPLATSPAPSLEALAACLSLTADQIETQNHTPISAGLGLDFSLIELKDAAALAAAAPSLDAFRQAAKAAGSLAIFCYTRNGAKIDARMFAPLGGILEDPATGSASAALSAYLGKLDGVSQSFEISQGVAMGRPSRILSEVTIEGGEPVEVAIAGRAVKVMEGALTNR